MVGRRLPAPKPGLKIHKVYDEGGNLRQEFQVGPHGRLEWTRAYLRPGYLGQGTATSSAAREYVRTHGAPGDQAGHAFPLCAGFRGDVPYNIFIQNGNFNQGVCAQWDQAIKNELEHDREGVWEIEFEFSTVTNPRPHCWHERVSFRGGFESNDTVENPVGTARPGGSMETGTGNYSYDEGRCGGCKEFKWTDRYDPGNAGAAAGNAGSGSAGNASKAANQSGQSQSGGSGARSSGGSGGGSSSRSATANNVGFKPIDVLDLVPVVGTVKVGAEAVGAFVDGNIGTGLLKTGLCAVSAVGDVCLVGGVGKIAVKGGSLVVGKAVSIFAQGGFVLGFLGRNAGRN